MAKKLPYRVVTDSGKEFELSFPLHDETESAVQVSQLLSALLETVTREIGVLGEVGNGDVLQALAMALAVRTRLLSGQSQAIDQAVVALLDTALSAKIEKNKGGSFNNRGDKLH